MSVKYLEVKYFINEFINEFQLGGRMIMMIIMRRLWDTRGASR